MKFLLFLLTAAFILPTLPAQAANAHQTAVQDKVMVSEGVLTIPTYQSPERDMNPPLFNDSTLIGLYPFTTYTMPFKEGGPVPEKYPAVFVENEYLKLTYIPELGGRFFSLYDKLHHREVFYRNDVIKPAHYNARGNFPLSGIELTGPYDAHSLTTHGEPYWSHTIVKHDDGSVSLMLGETDPIYHMNVTFSATLYPGVAAMKTTVFCYNGNDGQKPQMFWTSASLHSTPKTRFIYPMTRTVGHTTGEIADWPVYNGVDDSWDRNNKHMLGVFGIDTYDNFGGAYKFDKDYGLFRYADRRVVQGMKLWTFGYSNLATVLENAYTYHAGPYIEVQSGRMVWDGYYEYVVPHKVETWHEWWIPVAGIGGLTTLAQDVALNLTVTPDATGRNSSVNLALSPVRTIQDAKLMVKAKSGVLLDTTVNLVPGTPVQKTVDGIHTDKAGLEEMEVTLTAPDGKVLMDYLRPDTNPGGKQYSPFAKDLGDAPIPLDKMTAEQLIMAAQLKQKEMNIPAATDLAKLALQRDPGYSTAHQLLGVLAYDQGHFAQAAVEFQKAVDRNPYADESWYYLAICQLKLGQEKQAESNFYYIWPASTYYGPREYQLGRLAFLRHNDKTAEQHLLGAINSNGEDLDAHLLLAVIYRDQGKKDAAVEQLAKVSAIDPADRIAVAEKYFLTGDSADKSQLRSMMGEQSEDAIQVSIFYSSLERWKEAVAVLKMVEPPNNKDPWGTPPIYYYTLAYAQKQAGDGTAAASSRKKAQAASGIVERFPYRAESVVPLEDAVKEDPNDTVARFDLACLLYFRGHTSEAIEQWQAVNRINPSDFSARRSLGLAYAEQGDIDQAVAQLQKAIELKPGATNTLDDLATIYARAGRFDEQRAVLEKAVANNPSNDHLVEGLLNADLIQGKFPAAQEIIAHHTFAPQHRTYTIRDKYRELQYGMGAQAFNKGDYGQALKFFQAALKPPVSLGVDNFEIQSPRADYYIGRTYDAMGRKQEAKQAYKESIHGIDQLTGDRDSWNSDNFFMVLSLERLGRQKEASELAQHFAAFAETELNSDRVGRNANAHYLLALVDKYQGKPEQARKLLAEAVQAEPDLLQPRYELRGDALDPISTKQID